MDDIDAKMNKLKKELEEKSKKGLARVAKLIENDLDGNGNTILDKYPHRVELEPPLVAEKYRGFLDWLNENIKEDEFTRAWVTRVYFKNEEDAVAFKLRWM